MSVKKWLGMEPAQQEEPQEPCDYTPGRFDELLEKVYDPEYQAEQQAKAEEELRQQQWQEMPEMPLPADIAEIMRLSDGRCTETKILADLVCGCGSTRWRIRESNFRHLVRVCCRECNATYTIYDTGRCGWDALMSGKDFIERREPMQDVGCSECDGDTFHVRIMLTNPGRRAFLKVLNDQDPAKKPGHLLNERLDPKDWVNAYDRFRIDLECHRTGHQQIGWLDEERAEGAHQEEENDGLKDG